MSEGLAPWSWRRCAVGSCLAAVVFGLSPGGAKAFETRHAFIGSDGFAPASRLTPGPGGVLYGVTPHGGAIDCGTVFSLTPPSAGSAAWAFATIYDFPDARTACRPVGGLAAGPDGNLYGATGNTVFKLLRPAAPGGAWAFRVLHNFDGGGPGDVWQLASGPVLGPNGVLYGTAGAVIGVGNIGGVYSLSPPASGAGWTEAVIYEAPLDGSANAPSGSLLSLGGALYGVACGTGYGTCAAVALTPPAGGGAGSWQEIALAALPGGPGGNSHELIADAAGALYGTTSDGGILNNGQGTAFRLTPPSAGQTSWTETILHTFLLSPGDGGYPAAGLYLDPAGNLFGTTSSGGSRADGIVFELSPSAPGSTSYSETVLWNFTGGLDGAVPLGGLAADLNGNLYGTTSIGGAAGTRGANIYQIGYGTIFKLKP